jgi:hypothetical protein
MAETALIICGILLILVVALGGLLFLGSRSLVDNGGEDG